MPSVKEMAQSAKVSSRKLSLLPTSTKNTALLAVAHALIADSQTILKANEKDLVIGKATGLTPALLDRLALTPNRIQDMVTGLQQVAALPDPVGEIIDHFTNESGLEIDKLRVPMGVIGIIYEGRPNVTIDAFALCFKAGSAVLLRGSSTALNSNQALVTTIKKGLTETNLPVDAVQLIETTDRSAVDEMLRLNGLLDLVIPRGGAGLIRRVVENASVPVIETGVGNCHVYVDQEANEQMATQIILNAKCQRYGVCNAAETLLVHQDIASIWLPLVAKELQAKGVEIRGCQQTQKIISTVTTAQESDWSTEFLAPVLAVKVVNNLEEAITHIQTYSTGHSECIVTENQITADSFLQQIDAAAVYHNASTRFTDGFQYGFGAEIGISTQKLHARGPMGLKELTGYKYVVRGKGQIRI